MARSCSDLDDHAQMVTHWLPSPRFAVFAVTITRRERGFTDIFGNMDSMRTNPSKPVAFNDLLRQTTALQSELTASVNRVLAIGWYILGRECAAFEAKFAA